MMMVIIGWVGQDMCHVSLLPCWFTLKLSL